MAQQRTEPAGEDVGVDRPAQAKDVKRVLVPYPVVGIHTFRDLVDLGDEKGGRAGDTPADLAPVRRIERSCGVLVTVDEGSFEALCSARPVGVGPAPRRSTLGLRRRTLV